MQATCMIIVKISFLSKISITIIHLRIFFHTWNYKLKYPPIAFVWRVHAKINKCLHLFPVHIIYLYLVKHVMLLSVILNSVHGGILKIASVFHFFFHIQRVWPAWLLYWFQFDYNLHNDHWTLKWYYRFRFCHNTIPIWCSCTKGMFTEE